MPRRPTVNESIVNQCYDIGVLKFYPWSDALQGSSGLEYRGVLVEVMKIIQALYGFCFKPTEFSIRFGEEFPNGTWDGFVGSILDGNIEFAVGPNPFGYNRSQVVDFGSMYFWSTETFYYKTPKNEPNLMAFINNFSNMVWLWILIVLLFFSSCIIFVVWFYLRNTSIPNKIVRAPMFHDPNVSDLTKVKGTVVNCTFWTYGVLIGQDLWWIPNGITLKILTGSWLFFALFIGQSYKGNLKAQMISPKIRFPMNTVEDVIKSQLPVISSYGAAGHVYIKESPTNSSFYKLMDQLAFVNECANCTNNVKWAYNQAVTGTGIDFAPDAYFDGLNEKFFSQETFSGSPGKPPAGSAYFATELCFNYLIFAECPIYSLKQSSIGMIYGPIFTKDSFMTRIHNYVYDSLFEAGIIEYLYDRIAPNMSQCRNFKVKSKERALVLEDFYGIFALWITGLSVGFLIFLGEITIHHRS